MVRLAIRDDDISYFTNPDDLKNVYQDIPNFPISLAVIPFISGDNGACPESKNLSDKKYPIGKNMKLVNFLKESNYEILLHGITHEYKYSKDGQKNAEMIYRDDDLNLQKEIGFAKSYLERLLECKINIFVAPNNHIKAGGIRAIEANKMNFSGIISYKIDRELNLEYIRNYLYRWFFRIIEGYQYPAVLKYKNHLEINANAIYSYQYLLDVYRLCKRKNFPMVLNTHYWHLRDNPNINKFVIDFIKYALNDGATPSSISQCISN